MQLRLENGCTIHCSAGNCFLLALGFWVALTVESLAGLKIYYIRHAEAGHNVKEEWESVRKKDWPSFVGDQEKFTPRGEIQRTEAIRKLERYDFDFIAVSPMWRTRHTILPYLKATKTKAEIWPELHEMYVSSIIVSPDLPKHRGEILGKGDRIEIPDAEARYFTLRKDGTREFELPEFKNGHVEKEAETAAARVILQRVADMIGERFGSDDSILLVGHGSSGRGLLRFLLHDRLSGYPGITNAGVWMVEQQPDGRFELMIYNDVPLKRNK
ncbi:MAG: histidine phosphatase family protein [Verrucomicrobiales bacterium]|nr:histidine phosphatase family protein [Verrucomicrobiales bacterium]